MEVSENLSDKAKHDLVLLDAAKKAGASAMAAGSMFVYKRPHNAVLISYPSNYFYL